MNTLNSPLVHQFSWMLPADRTKAYLAFLEREALQQWFCEHANIEPHEEGAYRFWGRHTLDTANEDQATQKILAMSDGELLEFSWRLLGQNSRVRLVFADGDEANQCKVTGEHQFETTPEGIRVVEMIDDHWRLAHGNLCVWLNGGTGLCLPDYDDPSPTVKQSIWIDAPRDMVFKALITPELMKEWLWAENARVEAYEGGEYSYGWEYTINGEKVAGGPTRILEYVENEKLVTDWPDWRGDETVPTQRVTWLLADDADGTRVTLIHEGFIRATDISDFPFGWGDFLGMLKSTLEQNDSD